MVEKIDINEFLELSQKIPIIDVRTPAEFLQGHIPGAFNIPLFSNEERAAVGTKYKQANKEAAVLLGLEYVGSKLVAFVKQAKKISTKNEVLVHCWRGGMRSNSMAWLLNTSGLNAKTLDGGYKNYRAFIRNAFNKNANITVLGGMTGSGKSDILRQLYLLGEQIIDLEAIANHKGSAFGALGQNQQPTNEQFENNIYQIWKTLDLTKTIWIEDESDKIGNVSICPPLYDQMRSAPIVQINLEKSERIKRLVNEYSAFDSEILKNCIERISKRLGGLDTKLCLNAIDTNNYDLVADLTLNYYDKAYGFGLNQRTKQIAKTIFFDTDNPKENAIFVLNSMINSI